MKRTTNRIRETIKSQKEKKIEHTEAGGRQPEAVHLHVSGKEREGERRWV